MAQEFQEMHCIRLTNLSHTDTLSFLPLPSISLSHRTEMENLGDMFGSAADGDHQPPQAADLLGFLQHVDLSYLRLLQPGETVTTPNLAASEMPGAASRAPGHAAEVVIPAESFMQAHGVTQLQHLSSSEVLGESYIGTPELHPAPKRRRTLSSQGAPQQNLLSSLLEGFERALADAGIAAEQAEHEGHILPFCEPLRRWLELVMKLRARSLLLSVPTAQLAEMLSYLELPVGRGRHALDNESPIDGLQGQEAIATLDAAHVALLIVTTPGVPQEILKEELLDKIIDVISFHIHQTILPVYDPSLRKEKLQPDEGKAPRTSQKARQKGRGLNDSGLYLVDRVLDSLCTLLPLVASLLSATKLQETALICLSRAALSTFPVARLAVLQLKALSVLSAIFETSSQHHFSIMDDIIQLLWKVHLGKKQGRAFHLKEDPTQIHILSALILHAIQCSVKAAPALPSAEDPKISGGQQTREVSDGLDLAESEILERGFDRAAELSRHLWRGVLERWSSVKVSADLADARGTVEELVEDFITVFCTPEFPASSVLLQTLSISLDKEFGLKSENVAVRGMAIDLLGIIATRLKQEDLTLQAIKNRLCSFGISGDDMEVLQHSIMMSQCYLCVSALQSGDLLPCASCQKVCCHPSCLDVGDSRSPAVAWSCHLCSTRKSLKLLTSDTFCPEISLLLQQLIVEYLSTSSALEAPSAIRFLSAMWAKDAKGSVDISRIRQSWTSPPGSLNRPEEKHMTPLPRRAVLDIAHLLEASRPLARSFDALMSRLLASLHDKPVNRAKAMKAVSGIVEADPSELAKDHVRRDVEQRFLDSSISVREAAIDLVGKHIVQRPDVAAKYYDVICDRIKDKGVSVRKRAIKIIRGLCFQHQTFGHAVDACSKIFSRFNDEESSIRELVMKTLREMWFEGSDETPQSLEQQVAQATLQMVEVMKQPRSHQALVAIIRQSMFDESDSKPGKENSSCDGAPSKDVIGQTMQPNAAVRHRCELMCKELLKKIVEDKEGDGEQCKSLPFLVALQAFCDVDPTLCLAQMDPARYAATLLPYLTSQADKGAHLPGAAKQDRAAAARMCETIISIQASLLPHIRRPPQFLVDGLLKHLGKFIVQHEYMTVVQASVRCLCKLQDSSKQRLQPFFDLIQRFYDYLHNPNAPKAFPPRCLYALGLFCRYGAKHLMENDACGVSLAKITTTLKELLVSQDEVIKLKSLQALGLVCVARPEEMESSEIVETYAEYLSPEAPAPSKVQVLKNLCELALVSEEKPGLQPKGTPESGANTVAVAAGAGDSVTASGPIQRHWDAVLLSLLSRNLEVQQNALKLVEVALGQGIVFPITCVGHLIALAADKAEVTSSTSQRLLALINARWGGYKFIENKFLEGFRTAYLQFQDTCAEDPTPTKKYHGASGHIKDGLGKVYALVRPTGSFKQSVLNPIMKRFDHVDSPNRMDVNFLAFCTEVIAMLPFSTVDEVLYVVTEVSKIIHRRAGALLSVLKSILTDEGPLAAHALAAYQVLRSDRKKGPNGDKQGLGSDGFSDQGAIASVLEAPCNSEILEHAQQHADAASAISLLLLLKNWLKSAYNLSDMRCLAFGHVEANKTQEHASRRDVAELDLLGVTTQHPQQVCKVVQQYLLLKNLMKEDSGDYTGLPASASKASKKRGNLPSGPTADLAVMQNPEGCTPAQSAPPKRSQSRRRVSAGDHVPFPNLEQMPATNSNGVLSEVPKKGRRRSSAKFPSEANEG